ncbi:ribulokinase [Clostridium sp. AM58-1XD]|uniref:ribulokinase n=1 Tax=Clostridium sp. AM58-1XD TaxID=2292307 RepID=UPI000E49112D|nr:ribulokinase [Clostridium sp. AM58-1XD]RGY96466.1 ribulokinase [Clostridium sp. AM58-1XD]
MGKYTIGIDFGTLSGRCVLVDSENGKTAAESVCEYRHGVMDEALPSGRRLPLGGWALQHPDDYVEVLKTTIREVVEQAGIKVEEIYAAGIDFTACTMLPVLKDGTPLCRTEKYSDEPNAYVKLWKHHSAQKYADRLNELAMERKEPFLKRYGGKISSEWMIPKIMQTLDEAPELYRDTYSFMEAADWIVMQLTGNMTRNTSSLGFKAIWNPKDGYPPAEFFKELMPGLEHVATEKLQGRIIRIGSRAGSITKEAAQLTGLKEGTAVAAAHLDAAGASVGAGVITPGRMLIMMGTSSCHELLADEEVYVPGVCGYNNDCVIPGYIGYEAGQSCVGDHFEWLIKNCVPQRYFEEAEKKKISMNAYLSEKAAKKLPGETGLIALDWWNGNRSVLVNGDLTGMIAGMTLQTRPEDIYRALVEATAFGTRKIIENYISHGIGIEEVIIAGGIAQKNPFIMQIYADVLGKTVRIAGSKQNAALSSAIWAAYAAKSENGGYDRLEEAVEHMADIMERQYRPDQQAKEVYDMLYEEYEKLHDYFGQGLNPVMKKLKYLAVEQNKRNGEVERNEH